jgi:hypothetical protein
MVEQHRISYIRLGGGGNAIGTVDPAVPNDGYISALNLWQDGPESIGLTGDVAYIVEVTCMTTSDHATGFGTGATRRTAAYRLTDGYDGYFDLISESTVEDLGGQVYPKFFATFGSGYVGSDPAVQPEFQIRFKLSTSNGEYIRTRYFIKIEAWQPL